MQKSFFLNDIVIGKELCVIMKALCLDVSVAKPEWKQLSGMHN